MYALKALFTLLRLSSLILRFRRQSLTLGHLRSICVKSLSAKTATEWHIWNTRFGWLPVLQDIINFKLTKTLAGTWIFSLATAFSVVEVPSLCEFSTMSSKRNRETGSCDRGTGVWKKKRCRQVESILRPSRNPDLRDKGRSTLTVPRVKQIFPPEILVARTTLHRTSYRKRTMKHTHTHTQRERMLPTAKFMLPSNRCYAATNWATVTKEMFLKKSIFISFLIIRRYITFI